MKNVKCFLLLIAVAGFMMSCGGKKSKATKAAAGMCECSQASIDYQKKVKDAGTDINKLNALKDEGMKVFTETEACVKKLEAEYGKMTEDAEFEAAVMAAMKSKCPDAYDMMEGM